jgi:hypothetical protein
VPHADTGGPRAHGQAVEAGNLPRWAPRPMPDPARRAVHTMLWFPRGPHALGGPRRRERAHPNAMTPPRLPRARHTHRHVRRAAVLALHLLPPHAALAHLHLRRTTPPRGRRHLLALPPLRAAITHPHRAANTRPHHQCGHDRKRAHQQRPRHLSRGHHLPRVVPATVLQVVRQLNDDIVPMAMECRMSVFYNITTRRWKARDPSLLLHEPEPGLRGHVPR